MRERAEIERAALGQRELSQAGIVPAPAALGGRVNEMLARQPFGTAIALVLLTSCGHSGATVVAAKVVPTIIVCDAERRDDVRGAIGSRFPDAIYLWKGCERVRLIAEALPPECVLGGNSCELPEFVNGVRLANPSATREVVFVLTQLAHATRTETTWREEFRAPTSAKGNVPARENWKRVPRDGVTEIPGLSGPIYLLNARTAVVLEASAVTSATATDIANLLAEWMRGARVAAMLSARS